jgi:hypothetical protein
MSRNINRRSAWILAAALGFGAFVPLTSAKDTVGMDKVPPAARQQIQQATQGASKVDVYSVGDLQGHSGVYLTQYTDPAGRRMVVTVDDKGTVMSQGPTQAQRRKDEEAQLQAAKDDAQRAQIVAQRDAQDRAAAAAVAPAAAQAQPASATISPAPAPPSLPGRASPNAPALNERDLSEEYNSKDRVAVPFSTLPAPVQKTFDMETIGTKNKDYYKYTVDGKTFYSAHYDLGEEKRDITRVNESGKLLGKNHLNPAAEAIDKGTAPAGK